MSTARDGVVRARIDAIGKESFPDNPDVHWEVLGILHRGDYSFVETEPKPSTVGYPKFKFVLWFRSDDPPVVAGCYALERGRWTLLFTAPDAPTDWQVSPP